MGSHLGVLRANLEGLVFKPVVAARVTVAPTVVTVLTLPAMAVVLVITAVAGAVTVVVMAAAPDVIALWFSAAHVAGNASACRTP